jgi:glutaredoxin-like protein
VELLNKDVVNATKKKFEEELEGNVSLVLFTQESSRLVLPDHLKGQECLFCKESKQLMEEIKTISDKIELKIYDFIGDKEKAAEFGIDKIPATIVLGADDFGIRFFGIPSGFEYASLIESIIDASRGKTGLSQTTKDALKKIEKGVHIQVFVSPTCPYCPMVVRLSHQFAVESPFIKAEMVESTEFPHLAHKYNVLGVPKTVINETNSFDGAITEDAFLEYVLKAVNTEEKGKPSNK